MSNLLVYVSKTGTTKECVEKIVLKLLADTDVINLDEKAVKSVEKYKTVIIGSPIYMQKLDKKIVSFCTKNLKSLLKRNIVLFTVGMSTQEEADKHIKNSLPKELINHAVTSKHLGGRLNPGKGSFFIKTAVKLMMKDAGKYRIWEEKIEEIIKVINNIK